MTLQQFLTYLTAGGSIVAVSWVAERWAWFQAQSKDLKQFIIFGSSALLSVAAYALTTYADPAFLEKLSPFFVILSTTFGSIFLGQVFFKSMKKQAEG